MPLLAAGILSREIFMEIFYSPSYSGYVYAGLDKQENKILFNAKIANTQGLLDTIKLHPGAALGIGGKEGV